ncbi:MAG TPA: hypothetical protein VG456_16120 [Candidatus Sulfopaludibacter sp.]|nr:hypothetical protein [Candidatus Sulfopaludibacter sp.]
MSILSFRIPRCHADWLRFFLAAGCIAGLALSRNLWLTTRSFPLTPVWGAIRPLPPPWDGALFDAMLALLGWIGLTDRPRIPLAVFFLMAVGVCLEDQSRWQPWFYQYLVMLLCLGLARRKDEVAGLNACRLIIAAIYIWSGVAKLNPSFLHTTFPELTEPFTHAWPSLQRSVFQRAGILACILECALGLGLCTQRFRRAAMVGAIAMHLGILLAIGPLGIAYNRVVWPWNVAMIAFLAILFGSADGPPARDILWGRSFVFHRVVAILFVIAPAFRMVNLWDSYLSFALYSGNQHAAKIYLTDATFDRLPDELQDYVYEDGPNLNHVSITNWSLGELKVPPYSEVRIFESAARRICAVTGNAPDIRLAIHTRYGLVESNRDVSRTCEDLARRLE